MKIDWKSKNTKIVAIIIAVIVIPILWNQGNSIITGLITAYQMSQPKVVQVGHPEEREIYPEFETTGRVEAKYSVNIVARIEGWLEKRFFEEGDTVKKGQKLFLIEPDEYILSAKNARARVNENTAVYHNAQTELNRATTLLKQDLVSQEYYDDALTERNSTRAALDGSIAQLHQANLNVSYTNITSPMNGRIGKIEITEGNYVTPSSGTITTIYSTNPMRVNFVLKSEEFIAVKRLYATSRKNKLTDSHPVIVKLRLADGSIYEKNGYIEYIDNKIDESTGSVSLRAIFENTNEILVPGDFVNVLLKSNKKTKVMLIPQSATKTDIGTGYYVWVVKNGKTEKRNIVVKNNLDNNWIVESGLNYDDVVIMTGIQDIYQSGQPVKTEPYNPDTAKKTEESQVK